MGIETFLSWSKTVCTYDLNKEKLPKHVSMLMFDMNGILHDARSLPHEDFDSYFNNVLQLTEEYLKMFSSISSIGIYIDGVALPSKIQQQRIRRLGYVKNDEDIILPIELTPGTDLMKKISRKFKNVLPKLLEYTSDRKTKKNIPRIIYSSHEVPGEGELKMMEDLRRYNPKNCVCIGKDADLVLLTINIESNVTIIRGDDPYVGSLVHNIPKLKRFLDEKYISKKDFVLISGFLGNDYLPRFFCFDSFRSGMEVLLPLLEFYNSEEKYLVNDDNSINSDNLLSFLEDCILIEKDKLNERSKKKVQNNLLFTSSMEIFEDEQSESNEERSEELDIDRFRYFYYTSFFEDIENVVNEDIKSYNQVSEEDITMFCESALQVLQFIVYLNLGNISTSSLSYIRNDFPIISPDTCYFFPRSPMFSDLYNYLKKNSIPNHKQIEAFTANHQLPIVLPKWFPMNSDLRRAPLDDLIPKSVYSISECTNRTDNEDNLKKNKYLLPVIDYGRVVETIDSCLPYRNYNGRISRFLPLPSEDSIFIY
ncbi:MAG: hypothetical protein WBA74_04465 [Cyclobacteriaceae bacterium]